MEAASQSDNKPSRRLKGQGRTLISAIWFWRAAVTALFWVSWSERSPTRLQSFDTDSSDMVGRLDVTRRETRGTCIEVRGLDGKVSQGYRRSTFGESRDDGAASTQLPSPETRSLSTKRLSYAWTTCGSIEYYAAGMGLFTTLLPSRNALFELRLDIQDLANVPVLTGAFATEWKFRKTSSGSGPKSKGKEKEVSSGWSSSSADARTTRAGLPSRRRQ